MQLVDGRSAGNNQPSAGGYDNNDYSYGGGQQDDYQAAPRASNKPANNRPAPVANNDLDDDLPF
jgi:single-stranded DNA-binding protein